MADVKPLATKHRTIHEKSSRMNSNMELNTNQQTYINFGQTIHEHHYNDDKPINNHTSSDQRNQFHVDQLSSSVEYQPQQINVTQSSNFWIKQAANELLSFDNWDELGSVVNFVSDSPSM